MSDPTGLPVSPVLRPERELKPKGGLERVVDSLLGFPARMAAGRSAPLRRNVARVHRHGRELEGLSSRELAQARQALQRCFRRRGLERALVARGFALVRETAGRELGMRHHDVQLMGGFALMAGRVAEMNTGEGKTLTATLAASVAGLAGIPVHVVSVNDYLTARDAEEMRPLYNALGLSVGCVTHGMEPREKQAAYGCDITYCTNNELAFDYLRDTITLGERREGLGLLAERLWRGEARTGRLLLRGLHFALVDEADSVLIDEARTPLIISGPATGVEERTLLEQAAEVAGSLLEGEDYRLERQQRRIRLTDAGRERVTQRAQGLGPQWRSSLRRDELMRLALSATHLFRRDEHYLVRDGKVMIIDEHTGRVMEGRTWERGLHQLIELKEGVDLSGISETQARISYQRFFRRYHHLCGMTGTGREVAGELRSVYGLAVTRIPTHRRVKRVGCPERVFTTSEERWEAVLERVRALNGEGRPVLVGTASVEASEAFGERLVREGLEHRVLNARQDGEEAEIVAGAGGVGRITVTTRMAGRGTDIKLTPEVVARGGLHVMVTERHEASRIDRQLVGRCGRQGDPGSFEYLLSREDSLLASGRGGGWRRLAARVPSGAGRIGGWIMGFALRAAQRRMERYHAGVRREVLRQDERLAETMAFSGEVE